MPIFQNMVLFTSSYIRYIIYVCLNSWMSWSIMTDILYSSSSIRVGPSCVSDSSLNTINNTLYVSNYSFFIVFDFTTFFSLEKMETEIVHKLFYQVFDYIWMCTFKHTCNTFTTVFHMPILLTFLRAFDGVKNSSLFVSSNISTEIFSSLGYWGWYFSMLCFLLFISSLQMLAPYNVNNSESKLHNSLQYACLTFKLKPNIVNWEGLLALMCFWYMLFIFDRKWNTSSFFMEFISTFQIKQKNVFVSFIHSYISWEGFRVFTSLQSPNNFVFQNVCICSEYALNLPINRFLVVFLQQSMFIKIGSLVHLTRTKRTKHNHTPKRILHNSKIVLSFVLNHYMA